MPSGLIPTFIIYCFVTAITPGPLLLLDFVEISTCSAFSLPAAQRRKTLHKPTRLEEFRGMHWGYISIGEVIFP